MTLKLEAVPIPLLRDDSGAYRVGKSRVLLDILVREFNRGGDPESIARAYSTLELADIYAVVAYYLGHRPEVDALIRTRAQAAENLRKEIEDTQADRGDIRATLLARQVARGQEHAVPDK